MDKDELDVARRRRLVSELRSGGWAQATGALERTVAGGGSPAGFCCLGVACAVAIAAGATTIRREQGALVRIIYTDSYYDAGSSSLLPDSVMGWYGFTDPDPVLKVPQQVFESHPRLADAAQHEAEAGVELSLTATSLNDDYKLTFEQIADCFEYTFLREDWEARHGEDAG